MTNTGYWGGMRSAYLEKVKESSIADWLSKLCFKLTWGIVLKAVTPVHSKTTEWVITPTRLVRNALQLFPKQKQNPRSSHLNCLYTSAGRLGNKQEELELCAKFESYNVIRISKTWWENSRDWKMTMGGYKLFQKDRKEEEVGLHFM